MDDQQIRTLRHGGVPERYIWVLDDTNNSDFICDALMNFGAHRSLAYAYAFGYYAPVAAKWVLIRIGGLDRHAAQLVVELSAEREDVYLELPWSYEEASGDETTTVTVRSAS